MFDEQEDNLDGELVPRAHLNKLTMHITMAGKNVREELQLTSGSGLFGNTEPFAKLRIVDEEDGSVLSEANLPLKDWLGRLVGLLKDTSSAIANNTDSSEEIRDASGNLIKAGYDDLDNDIETKQKHKYIFNRDE